MNIGIEGHLYTRYDISGQKDLSIERWFSQEIEGPFVEALDRLTSGMGISISPLPAIDREKERNLRDLGFVVPNKVERLLLSREHRRAIDCYLAALLVRNPVYLAKIAQFHDRNEAPLPVEVPRNDAIKTIALDNMLSVFRIYQDRIAQSHLGLLYATGDNELLFSDAGITAEEPWRPGTLPFDIHAPLTPTMALEVLPTPNQTPGECFIMRMNNQGIARMNRLALADAQRFVFSRQRPPIEFIKSHFGKPAPKSIGIRPIGAGVVTKFDRSRDH